MQLKKSIKQGRNELCQCGSKIKYKKCCLKKEQKQEARRFIENGSKQERIKSKDSEKKGVQEGSEEPEGIKEEHDK